MSSKAQAPETEADTRSRYISPALVKSGWQFRADSICEEYYFTDGKILVRGKSTARGERKKVDYLLLKDEANRLAVIEAKSTSFSVGHGLQQAIGYALQGTARFGRLYRVNQGGAGTGALFTGLAVVFLMVLHDYAFIFDSYSGSFNAHFVPVSP